MEPQRNVPLAPLTSLATGGSAEKLYICNSSEELESVLQQLGDDKLWVLGYGANALISDAGLPGTTVLVRSTAVSLDDHLLVADAGVWWDDVVQYAIAHNLWGLELTSAIPGGVGAAVVGNIAAYGQAIADTFAWVEVYDLVSKQTRRIAADELGFSYRFSAFQTDEFKDLVILRAAFDLRDAPMQEVTYQAVLDAATALKVNLSTLAGRRQAVLEARKRAGSLWDYRNPEAYLHTAGSFFRNPLVSEEKAEELMGYDETGRSAELLKQMNRVHGGDQKRVSAAHVLLAAGFERGQTWGPVRLHPDHILKIENTGGATAQQIYDVAMEIVHAAKVKLGVDLVPEVRFLGDFA